MKSISRLINISRPRFWIYELGPYIVGVAGSGFFAKQFDLKTSIYFLIFFIFFTFPINLLIYGINDIFDYETDRLNPKKKAYESLLMPDEHGFIWKSIMITSLPFLFFIDLKNTALLVSFAVIILTAIFYSAPPLRAKSMPMIDMVISSAMYIFTGVFGYILGGASTDISILYILAGMFWAMAMHIFSAVPDIESDEKSGLKTTATFLGKNVTLILCIIFYTISGILSFHILGILSIVFTLMYISLMISSFYLDTFKVYKIFPIVNLTIGFLIFWQVILNIF